MSGARFLHDLLDLRAASTPEAPALTERPLTWTYRELRERSSSYAAWLRREGVGRGDRVLIIGPHAAQSVALVYATSRLDAVFAVISDQVRPYLLEHILRDSTPALVIGTPQAAAMARGRSQAPTYALQELPANSAPSEPPPSNPGSPADPVAFIYTSGSTAMPKAVISPHRQVLFAVEAIQRRLGYRPTDRVWCCLPLSFDYGLYQAFL